MASKCTVPPVFSLTQLCVALSLRVHSITVSRLSEQFARPNRWCNIAP